MDGFSNRQLKIFLGITALLVWMLVVFFVDARMAINRELSRQKLTFLNAETHYRLVLLTRPRCGDFWCQNGNSFVTTYLNDEARRVDDGELSFTNDQVIFGSKELSSRVAILAGELGYRYRPFVDESKLVLEGEIMTLPEVSLAYRNLRDAMQQDGLTLHLVSGYRSFETQEEIFRDRLDIDDIEGLAQGSYTQELIKVMERTAPPGYSKHHSGHAVDFACGNNYQVYDFADSACYTWMSENNFAPIKQFGFIPSYPADIADQGPEPEPWEYVWVGTEVLK